MTDLTAVSLFAGVEGFGLALERCGIPVVASVEIDPDCRGVIARHFPQTHLFSDVTEVTGDQLRAAGFVPERGVLTFGFPCTDLSVAGRRLGLGKGTRSGLFWEAARLLDELRPAWFIAENVPGLLSAVCSCPGDETCTDNGRTVAGGCGEWRPVPGKPGTLERLAGFFIFRAGKWHRWFPRVPHTVRGGACATGCMAAHGGAMGSVLGALGERGYGFAYRVLDSRFFGVAQRRERVFIVGCLGDRAAPVEVLLEPEGGEGNPAASRKARQGASGRASGDAGGTGELAPTITAGWGTNHGAPGHGGKDEAALAVTAATLQGGGKRGHRIDAEGASGGHLIPFDTAQITSWANRSNPRPGDPAPTLNGSGLVHVAPQGAGADQISPALTARQGKGPDSDATNGFIVAPLALRGRGDGSNVELGEDGGPAFTLRTPGGGSSYPTVAATLTSGAHGNGTNAPGRHDEDQFNLVPVVTHALTSEGADASEDGTGRGTVTSGVPRPVPSSLARLQWQGGSNQDQVIGPEATSPTLAHSSNAHMGHHQPKVMTELAVRRLTPLECERLQGFPDEWTRWKLVNGDLTEQSDSARYRQIGNAVTVDVPQWIARRLLAADADRLAVQLEAS